jgi:hypothetical protein
VSDRKLHGGGGEKHDVSSVENLEIWNILRSERCERAQNAMGRCLRCVLSLCFKCALDSEETGVRSDLVASSFSSPLSSLPVKFSVRHSSVIFGIFRASDISQVVFVVLCFQLDSLP